MNKNYDFIIVGAGLCGLHLGKRLQDLGHRVLILEKSKGVGGRMATRRHQTIDPSENTNQESNAKTLIFDHGTPFLKWPSLSNTDSGYCWLKNLEQAGLLHNLYKESYFEYKNPEDRQHYECWIPQKPGITSIAKFLAQDLQIAFMAKVLKVEKQAAVLAVHTESGHVYVTSNLILTSPLPQCLDILKNSNLDHLAALQDKVYAKTLVGLFVLEDINPATLQDQKLFESFKYLENINSELFSIYLNSFNLITNNTLQKSAWTVTMTPHWSEQYFEHNDDIALALLEAEFLKFYKSQVSDRSTVAQSQLKKWRLAFPQKTFSEKFLQVMQSPSIYLAGDGFGAVKNHQEYRSMGLYRSFCSAEALLQVLKI